MIKVLQFGEGNFLRTFVDAYLNTLNKEQRGPYEVIIVKPRNHGSLDQFHKQQNKYNIVLRGQEQGQVFEEVYPIDCVKDVFSPFENEQKFYSLACDEELCLVVSNTTEAGICFSETDRIDSKLQDITYPAKLTKFLFARYEAGLKGLYILPVELIDHNAEELYRCVDEYITLWHLPEAFRTWNDHENYYCNTLVDRIVSGYPREEETKHHITELIGYEDGLVSIGEPFGLWAIEKKGALDRYIVEGKHNIDVVLTEDISYYKKRKVRVLNGSHTNLVPLALLRGKKTVYDCMVDPELSQFVSETLKEEIIPFVSQDIDATTQFAESVKERFLNPYLNHQLISISLNSISKWKARVLPSFEDYYRANGHIAPHLATGFGALMALYTRIYKEGTQYFVNLPIGKTEFKDELQYLDYFAQGGRADAFMRDETIWGQDLTKYEGFVDCVHQFCEENR